MSLYYVFIIRFVASLTVYYIFILYFVAFRLQKQNKKMMQLLPLYNRTKRKMKQDDRDNSREITAL